MADGNSLKMDRSAGVQDPAATGDLAGRVLRDGSVDDLQGSGI